MQQSVQVEKWRAHINPTALQITWIAFCLVTPTTQTGHKKRGAASDAQCNNWCIKAGLFASTECNKSDQEIVSKNWFWIAQTSTLSTLRSKHPNPYPISGDRDETGICQKCKSQLGLPACQLVVQGSVSCDGKKSTEPTWGSTPPPHSSWKLGSWPGIKTLGPAVAISQPGPMQSSVLLLPGFQPKGAWLSSTCPIKQHETNQPN